MQKSIEQRAAERDAERSVFETFFHRQPTPEQVTRIEKLRVGYSDLCALVQANVQNSADRTAGLRTLHESMMTNIKGIIFERVDT